MKLPFNFELLKSLKIAKNSQLWVVETFFSKKKKKKKTGRGTIWVEKRWPRPNLIKL
jgi:hypothetical protein